MVKMIRKCKIPTPGQKVQKNTIRQISRKRCIGRKNASVTFLCGSSRAIQWFLFQVATTNSFRVMKNVDSVQVRKTQNRKYLENGAPDEKNNYVQHFCAARREESNGLYSRSIRPIVFLVMTENVNLTFDLKYLVNGASDEKV